jgi:hypothetical protein
VAEQGAASSLLGILNESMTGFFLKNSTPGRYISSPEKREENGGVDV